MTPAEKWARKTLLLICKEYEIPEPSINWRLSTTKHYTSGHCWYCWPARITVTEGGRKVKGYNSEVDAKEVFLHEMAHAITRGKHDYRFYVTLWTLIRQYKLPIKECQQRNPKKGPGRRAYLDTRPGRATVTYNGRRLEAPPGLVAMFQIGQ